MELAFDSNRHYTYADYLAWPAGVRCELIDGRPMPLDGVAFRPIPREFIVDGLHRQLSSVLTPGTNRLLIAADLTGRVDDAIASLRPDLCILTAASHPGNASRMPTWVLQVVDVTNAAHDIITKRRLYEQAGVREFWLVHPLDRVLTVHTLGTDGLYGRSHLQTLEGQTELATLPGTRIDWDQLQLPTLAADFPPLPNRSDSP